MGDLPCRRGFPSTIPLLAALLLLSSVFFSAHAEAPIHRTGRSLLGFKEKHGNATFECSPAGPCVACHYSEKNDENYRCSETGYRIPLKCVKTGDGSTNGDKRQKRSILEGGKRLQDMMTAVKHHKWRRLSDDSTTAVGDKQNYITYRSCVPTINEESLTVLGFEGIMLVLLAISGPALYFRRKRSLAMSVVAPIRIPTNSRF